MKIIMKSGKKNWSGKEFSNLPAKIFSSFDDAVEALNCYHFFIFDNEKCEYVPCQKKEKIEIIPLSASDEEKLLATGQIQVPKSV